MSPKSFEILAINQFSAVPQSCLTLCDPMDCSTPGFPVHRQFLELAQTHVHQVNDAIQPSHSFPFSFCLQSFPASESFPVSLFLTWTRWSHLRPSGGQSIGVSASTSVIPMITQDWFPLGWIGLISFQSKGLSGVFFSTTVQKHQFFGVQLSLWYDSHLYMTVGKNNSFEYTDLFW